MDRAHMLLVLLMQNLIFVAIALYGWRRQRLSLTAVGMAWPTPSQVLQALGMGVGVFAVAYSAGLLLENLAQLILPHAKFAELIRFNQERTAVGGFLALTSPWSRLGYVLIGVFVVPVGEEALFRGLLYRATRIRWGVPAGVFASALVFAVVHVSPLAICVIFLIGLMLALAYERSGSLVTPILMHAVNNGLMFLLLWQHGI